MSKASKLKTEEKQVSLLSLKQNGKLQYKNIQIHFDIYQGFEGSIDKLLMVLRCATIYNIIECMSIWRENIIKNSSSWASINGRSVIFLE